MEKLGNFVALLGILIMLGNLTGLVRTFPFAGFITIAVGHWIARIGK